MLMKLTVGVVFVAAVIFVVQVCLCKLQTISGRISTLTVILVKFKKVTKSCRRLIWLLDAYIKIAASLFVQQRPF